MAGEYPVESAVGDQEVQGVPDNGQGSPVGRRDWAIATIAELRSSPTT